jgi:hypothetical protein
MSTLPSTRLLESGLADTSDKDEAEAEMMKGSQKRRAVKRARYGRGVEV